jgi:hypothetical protein
MEFILTVPEIRTLKTHAIWLAQHFYITVTVVETMHRVGRCTMRLEIRYVLTKCVGSDVHEGLYWPETFHFIRKHFLQICLSDVSY